MLAQGGAPLLPRGCGVLASNVLLSETTELLSAALRGKLKLTQALFFAALSLSSRRRFRRCRRSRD